MLKQNISCFPGSLKKQNFVVVEQTLPLRYTYISAALDIYYIQQVSWDTYLGNVPFWTGFRGISEQIWWDAETRFPLESSYYPFREWINMSLSIDALTFHSSTCIATTHACCISKQRVSLNVWRASSWTVCPTDGLSVDLSRSTSRRLLVSVDSLS